jgi:5'(3')-deoxyribonucleotidase
MAVVATIIAATLIAAGITGLYLEMLDKFDENSVNIFWDMDGTLARFYAHNACLELMHEEGFFGALAEYETAVKAVDILAKKMGVNVALLSACIDTPYCRQEKEAWCIEHFASTIPVILCKTRVSKAEMVEKILGRKLTKKDILIDDYSANLVDWEEHGGTAIKFRNEINGIGTNGTNFRGPQVFYTWEAKEIVSEILKVAGIPYAKEDLVPMRDRLMQKIEDFLRSKPGMVKEDGVWYEEIYANYDDKISEQTLRTMFQSGDPGFAFYELMDEWYGDEQHRMHYALADELREYLTEFGGRFSGDTEEFLDPEVEDVFQEIVNEYDWDVRLPYDHYLDQPVYANIFVDAGDRNRDFVDNVELYRNLNQPETISDNSGLLLLGKLCGYSKADMIAGMKHCDAIREAQSRLEASLAMARVDATPEAVQIIDGLCNKWQNDLSPDISGFIGTVYQELENLSGDISVVTFLVKTSLRNLIALHENVQAFTAREKAVVIEQGAFCGLYDPWNGGGSVFEIRTDCDIKLPLSNIFSVAPDGTVGNYSVEETYGMCKSAWKEKLLGIVAADEK